MIYDFTKVNDRVKSISHYCFSELYNRMMKEKKRCLGGAISKPLTTLKSANMDIL